MRLLNTKAYQLEEYIGNKVPSYAILSHRWGEGEVSYSDYRRGRNLNGPGYDKIIKACNFAWKRGQNLIWIDTCCIDKKSSAELSEAINSMFSWYRSADECYAYLADAHSLAATALSGSEWFSRGWTLQELIAPRTVFFCDSSWRIIGDKREKSLDHVIAELTGIPVAVLWNSEEMYTYSVAERMSWAAGRTTTRTEDAAYSLLGIFRVNMPLLYGEGQNAFFRLQREVMNSSLDESILTWSTDIAWSAHPSILQTPGRLSFPVLANSLQLFAEAAQVRRRHSTVSTPTIPRFIPGPGSLIEFRPSGPVEISQVNKEVYVLSLACFQETIISRAKLDARGKADQADPLKIILCQVDCGHYERMFSFQKDIYDGKSWPVVEDKTFYPHAASDNCYFDKLDARTKAEKQKEAERKASRERRWR